jgi:hypothetical protein
MKRTKNKLVIVLIILIFGVFAYLGFKTAAKILQGNNQYATTDQTTVETDTVVQQNFLLIHLNDLTQKKPELISVWVGFVYPSDPPQLMFIPLFPSYDEVIHSSLLKKFSLNTDKTVSDRFISQISKSYDIQTSGYILTDDVGITYSNLWLTGQNAPVTSTPAMSDAEKLTLRMSGQSAYESFCQVISSGSSKSYFSAVDWTLLLPSHFSTNIPFETIALITDKLARAATPVKCDVLSSE